MPSRENRERRRRKKSVVLPILITLCMIAAAVLIFVLMRTQKANDRFTSNYPQKTSSTEQTEAPLVVLKDASTPVPAATAEPQETVQPEVENQETSNRLMPQAKPFEYFIPVCEKALRTQDDKNMIAVTVDGCGNSENLYQMANIAYKYNCKLTLFPFGEFMMKEDVAKVLRSLVRNLGYELENHGYNVRSESSMADGEVLMQIWRQSIATSFIVGKDYQQHFFRPYNRSSNYDQRTHFYAGRLGFIAIGGYTHSYQNYASADLMAKTLANGKIYQFDTTDKSVEMFESFLIEANKKGFSMVTMNELFGLQSNEVGSSLTIDKQELPEIEGYEMSYYDLEYGYRTRAVYDLQNRLIELGYIEGRYEIVKDDYGAEHKKWILPQADGVYGEDTSKAVSIFQGKSGLAATGNADVETLNALFAPDAVANK